MKRKEAVYLCALMGELLDILYAGIAIYFLYKFVTGLIMPVSRASSDMRSKIKKMQEMQQEEMRKQNQQADTPSPKAKAANTGAKGDYIDFEEIK